ncbi:zinc finger BED domain-containing protein 4-like [Rhagoletis pomonella]|uniref:zinc finger BED domain-containing protein 4-like n=1 Tax=Rhagoletis pomonella TaxID=28610 RepID=UPI00177CDA33|nr:zinc finger BED domain-containing protein 4-like [Rhagoletis pomonella]
MRVQWSPELQDEAVDELDAERESTRHQAQQGAEGGAPIAGQVSSLPQNPQANNTAASVVEEISSFPRNTQTNITEFCHRPPSTKKVEKIDKQVLKMIAKGHHALRIVEEPEFKKLLEMVSHCPGYKLPSRKTLSTNLMAEAYNELLEKIKIRIKGAAAVCLTTDGWQSRTTSSFIAITAHFINDSAELESYLLGCDEFVDSHTASNLYNFIRTTCEDFNISNKVTAIVSDNAANIKAAIRLGGWRGISCFAHSLHLIVMDGMKTIDETLSKVKKVVEHFRRSPSALKKLLEIQKQMGLPEVKLKQDVPTRWNSSYLMLERVIHLKDALIATYSILHLNMPLSVSDWEIIEEAMPCLLPFYQITQELFRSFWLIQNQKTK